MSQSPQTVTTGLKPLIIQSDKSMLLDVHAPGAEDARRDIGPFAELEKAPEHLHTYRITPLSLWNAAAAGVSPADVVQALNLHSRYAVPGHLGMSISETMARFGLIKLMPTSDPLWLFLAVLRPQVFAELAAQRELKAWLHQFAPAGVAPIEDRGFWVRLADRGTVKQALIHLGWPAQDEVPLLIGDPFNFGLKLEAPDPAADAQAVNDIHYQHKPRPFALRPYQEQALDSLLGDGRPGMGYGTVVLPCGAGKTIVGIGAMHRLQASTLILTTNVAAVHQWIRELKEKTDIPNDDIGEYTGDNKNIRPITVATYQILVWRPDRESDFPHFGLLRDRAWGLVIYDEVHLLPAPVFRVTAEIQALRRLGLTATLVREDGMEADVFSLVGPKRYDVPWKDMEAQGWIASAWCNEIRIDLPEELAVPYAVASLRQKFVIASTNPVKEEVAEYLIAKHIDDSILVIGQYLDQLDLLAKRLNAPLITGKTPNKERDRLYQAFRDGEIRVIVVSKVANFAIDLPDASVAIQVSGTFGSRQEEAQRLGRILRPKKRDSHFYTLVTRFTSDEEFSANRQKFLTEQGYRYNIELWSEAKP